MVKNTRVQAMEQNTISATASRKVFDIYNVYRLVLGLILQITYLLGTGISSLGSVYPELFYTTVVIYVVFNVLVLLRVFIKSSATFNNAQFIVVTLIDIFMLTLLSYTCGGVSSGMAHLLIFPVAAGSIFFRSKLGAFFAAVATISAISSEVYLYLKLQPEEDYFFQVGILGLTLFTISVVLAYLGNRIRQNEELALLQAEDIESLQEMNLQIIQRMQTGIIVVGVEGQILNMNTAAYNMMTNSEHQRVPEPDYLPDTLMQIMTRWMTDPGYKPPPFRFNQSTAEIQANFSYLQQDRKSTILIFLEDYTRLASRLQHMKLMSLGRLTASIAHEIRNPLGAISHASQLLKESDTIDSNDMRLLEIIENHSDRVNSIIESILQLSRSKNEVPDSIQLTEWMETFIYKFTNSQSELVNIEVNIQPEDLAVQFNTVQLEQVLTNLFENGLRYSKQKNGTASLEIMAYIHPDNDSPVLDVIDSGDGLDAEHNSRIFEPFFTTESTGTGLGLFICKEICEANQAGLSYSRTSDNKTCFRITFPHQNRKVNLN